MKGIVPFLKIDQGLVGARHSAQTMKSISGLEDLLVRAVRKNVFGIKTRSVIRLPGEDLNAVITQQFMVARQVFRAGWCLLSSLRWTSAARASLRR